MRKKITRGYKLCSDISISSAESPDSLGQPSNSEEYEQLNLLKLIPTHSESCDRISQEFQFIPTSETTEQNQESLKSLPAGFPAQAQVTQELERDYLIQNHFSGEKVSEYCSKLNPSSLLLNNLKDLSNEDLELFLPPYIWQDTVLKLKQSRRRSLEQDIKDLDCLSFPTLTSGQTSTTMRPAGQTKCEKWFKDKGLIPTGSQLSAEAIAMIMGFPPNWFDCLNSTKPQEESEPDISQEEALHQDKQPLPSVESSISMRSRHPNSVWMLETTVPCLVKQPHKQPFEGLIVGDRGSEFDVKVDDRVVSLPKLYVFPNFQKQKKKCQTDDDISPSKIRRKKGTGSGSIYWRTIKKNGKDYQQTYYHYEIWDKGDRLIKSCEYIPKRMRSLIEKMNDEKAPVEEILKVLRNRGKRKK
jgi:hypothetical protein